MIWGSCKQDPKIAISPNPTVLIYAKTKAYHHDCIEPGSIALQSYFSQQGVNSTFTTDSSFFNTEKLNEFDAVLFFQTTGNVLDSIQQIAFEKYIRSGKGFVGIHAASDTEYDWPWYGKLVGAYFSSHPDIQTAALQKTDTSHMSCKHLPARWTRTDEWYNFKEVPKDVDVLLAIDEATYDGGTMGENHPMSWCHLYDGGRSFYTALGHTVESYKDTMFLEHVLQGVKWACLEKIQTELK
jgi:type 1 glutamine amidotransferase